MASPSTFVPKRSVMVIGKVGCGKSTLINKIIGGPNNVFPAKRSFHRVTDRIRQTKGKKTIDEQSYEIFFMDTIGIGDAVEDPSSEPVFSNPQIIAKIKTAIKDRFKDGINLIFVTLQYNSFKEDDKDMFKILQTQFKPAFWDLAVLVITHCENIKDWMLQQYIEELKSNEPAILKFKDRIVTVGFPDLETLDVPEEVKQQYKESMKKDVKKLDKFIRDAVDLEPYVEIACEESSTCDIL